VKPPVPKKEHRGIGELDAVVLIRKGDWREIGLRLVDAVDDVADACGGGC
jgi:hypothetical protein